MFVHTLFILIVFLVLFGTITFVGFPAITTFLLYSAIQILASKTIKYARFEDNKKFTDGLINDTANYFSTELLTRGLVKVGDKTIVINALKEKLSELWKGIENFAAKHVGKPISLANGTIAFKQYNGETATPQEFYERVLRNYYKKVKERANKREIVKKRLPNEVRTIKIDGVEYKEIWLPKSEYNKVLKVHNNELSIEQKSSIIYQNDIYPYRYYVINDGFNEPIIVGKELLDDNYRL